MAGSRAGAVLQARAGLSLYRPTYGLRLYFFLEETRSRPGEFSESRGEVALVGEAASQGDFGQT